MKEPDQVDWNTLMRFGLGVLGLAPRDFWDMTPAEFTAAAEGRMGKVATETPMNRATLRDLIRQNPDQISTMRGKPA